MTDEIIVRLGRIDAVQVKSRLSVARFRESDRDVSDIASELGVNLVLEGAVRKAGNRLRVTAQLTDAGSGFQEWSDVFNSESDDWFALHEAMATQIAEALDVQFSREEDAAVRAHYTENAEAYDAFWQGWLLLESFHADASHPKEKFLAAEMHLQRALELDPQYPLALAGLSLANSYAYFYGAEKTDERLSRGLELARQALGIDPDFPEGRVALGMAFAAENDHAAAADEFRKALGRDSESGMIWCMLAFSCIAQEPPDLPAAEEAARIAIRHDPTWTYSYQMLGWSLFLQGRYAESAEAYQRGVEFNPDYSVLHFGLGQSHLELGNYHQASEAFTSAHELNPSADSLINLAASYVGLDDADAALDYLGQGLEMGFSYLDAIQNSPYFAPLRDDPRFVAVIESYRNR